jgi:hypothetical protein
MGTVNKTIILYFIAFTFIVFYTFYFKRAESDYIAEDQTYAKVDASYYNYLIYNKINSVDDVFIFSPNIETSFFLCLLLLTKKIGIVNPFSRLVFNFIIILIPTLVLFKSLKKEHKIRTKLILFLICNSPIIYYALLNSKETYIYSGYLILFNELLKNYQGKKNFSYKKILFGLLLLLLARPVVGFITIISMVLSRLLKPYQIIYLFFLVLILFSWSSIHIDQLNFYLMTYQDLNIKFQDSSCSVLGINICYIEGNIFDSFWVSFKRLLIWLFLFPFKAISDIFIINYKKLDLFEIFISYLNVFSSFSLFSIFLYIRNMKIRNNKLYLFLIVSLISISIAGAVALFFQTRRIFYLFTFVSTLIYLIPSNFSNENK